MAVRWNVETVLPDPRVRGGLFRETDLEERLEAISADGWEVRHLVPMKGGVLIAASKETDGGSQ